MKLLIGNYKPYGKPNATVHLYNLTSDPYEMNDISKEYPATVGSLKNRLSDYVKSMITPNIAEEILAGSPHLNGGVFGPGWCQSRPEEDATTTTKITTSGTSHTTKTSTNTIISTSTSAASSATTSTTYSITTSSTTTSTTTSTTFWVVDFCKPNKPCGENEGDCDSDNECKAGLLCGKNNCPKNLGYEIWVDCCYSPSNHHYQPVH